MGRYELLPRGTSGALLETSDAVLGQVRELVALGEVGTVCVHGDTPGAVELAFAVRQALDEVRS